MPQVILYVKTLLVTGPLLTTVFAIVFLPFLTISHKSESQGVTAYITVAACALKRLIVVGVDFVRGKSFAVVT